MRNRSCKERFLGRIWPEFFASALNPCAGVIVACGGMDGIPADDAAGMEKDRHEVAHTPPITNDGELEDGQLPPGEIEILQAESIL